MIVWTPFEVEGARKNPDALRAIANQHDCAAAEAAAIGPEFRVSVEYHEARAAHLRAEAALIESNL